MLLNIPVSVEFGASTLTLRYVTQRIAISYHNYMSVPHFGRYTVSELSCSYRFRQA